MRGELEGSEQEFRRLGLEFSAPLNEGVNRAEECAAMESEAHSEVRTFCFVSEIIAYCCL
jgi:hypothetical protein